MSDTMEKKKRARPRCFFDVEVGGLSIGRIVFELYSDLCPLTCENFRALCTGEKGLGSSTGKPLHYKGIVFHRVVKDFIVQGGDFTAMNGSGGESIYGGTFADENLGIKHDKPFLLSMANRGKDTNGSQFFITTQPAPHLDGVHVVFGQVVSGQTVVTHIEQLPVDRNSRPLQDAKVVNCGQLVLKNRAKAKKAKKNLDSSSETGNESEAKKKKKHKKNKKRKKEKKEKSRKSQTDGEASEEGEVSERELHPLVSLSNINPEEIPEIPPNRFLFRGGNEKNDNGKDKKEKGERRKKKSRIRGVTKSGRVIKGRGVFRYRTPSRSRSRSVTPPHWRQAQKRTIKLTEYEKKELEKINKEEEIKRREEARKKRHQEKSKMRERDTTPDQESEGHTPQHTPPRPSAEQSQSSPQGAGGSHLNGKSSPAPASSQPLDLNALDYESAGSESPMIKSRQETEVQNLTSQVQRKRIELINCEDKYTSQNNRAVETSSHRYSVREKKEEIKRGDEVEPSPSTSEDDNSDLENERNSSGKKPNEENTITKQKEQDSISDKSSNDKNKEKDLKEKKICEIKEKIRLLDSIKSEREREKQKDKDKGLVDEKERKKVEEKDFKSSDKHKDKRSRSRQHKDRSTRSRDRSSRMRRDRSRSRRRQDSRSRRRRSSSVRRDRSRRDRSRSSRSRRGRSRSRDRRRRSRDRRSGERGKDSRSSRDRREKKRDKETSSKDTSTKDTSTKDTSTKDNFTKDTSAHSSRRTKYKDEKRARSSSSSSSDSSSHEKKRLNTKKAGSKSPKRDGLSASHESRGEEAKRILTEKLDELRKIREAKSKEKRTSTSSSSSSDSNSSSERKRRKH